MRSRALLVMALLPFALLVPAFARASLPPIDATTSLLVVSPHPDDETLCCAGVIQRVRAAGGQVSVVWITSGDGSVLSMLIDEETLLLASHEKARELATLRLHEARAAASLLGVPAARQFFLRYPDGGVSKQLPDERLARDFTKVLEQVRPTLILAPSPKDTHPDHRASGLVAIAVLTGRGELAKARFWIVHGGEGWPSPRAYMPFIPLTVPPVGRGLQWSFFDVTDTEAAHKLQAIEAYRSQMHVMGPFLVSFVRTNELYSSTP